MTDKLVRLSDVEEMIKNTLQRYSPDTEYLTPFYHVSHYMPLPLPPSN